MLLPDFIHTSETFLATHPKTLATMVGVGAALAVSSLCAILARVYVGFASKDDPENNRRAAAFWAYQHPRMLRITQSPCWFGGLLVGAGLTLGAAYVAKPSAQAMYSALYEAPTPAAVAAQNQIAAAADAKEIAQLWWEKPSMKTFEQAQAQMAEAHLMEGIGLGLMAFGVLVAFWKWKREKIGERFHGRAAWAARSEVQFSKKHFWCMPLRVTQDGTRTWEETASAPYTALAPSHKSAASMGLILGALGSGKGAYLMGHWFVTATVPVVYQDSKGECPASSLRPGMLRFGIPAKKPKGLPSMRFNPIDSVNEEGISQAVRETRARTLANLVLPAPREGSENAWITETAQPLLADGFLRGRWANLGELADEVEGRPLPVILDNLAVAAGRQFALAGKNVLEYASNEISNNTQPYLRGWARHAFSASDFTWSDVTRDGLFIMSATEDKAEKLPIQLFWNLFWAELQSSDTEVPMLVLMDEAIAAGPVPNILDAVVKLRDRKCSIWMAYQTLSGIEHVYGKAQGEAVRRALVNSIVLTNGLDAKDAHEIANELGTFTHTEKVGKDSGKRREKYPLIPESDLHDLSGRENEHWAIFRGRGITSSGRPLLAKLFPIPQGCWNVKTTIEDYEALEAEFGHNEEPASAFKFCVTDEYRELSNLAVEAAKGDRIKLLAYFRAVEAVFASDLENKAKALGKFLNGDATLEEILGRPAHDSGMAVPDTVVLVSADGAPIEDEREDERPPADLGWN